MSAFKLHTLKQKLWAIVAASFVARVIVFFTLPSTPSFLAPDEATYAGLTRWIGESRPALEFPGYGEKLYQSGRSIIIPSSILFRAGFNELDAVRLTSSLYGLCSSLLVTFFILSLKKHFANKVGIKSYNENLITRAFTVFTFLPSHFIWSNLGLRESATEFWLIMTFICLFTFFHSKKRIGFVAVFPLFGSILLTFSSRPQVGWVLSVSLILYLLLKIKSPRSLVLIPLVFCAAYLGGTMTLGSTGISSDLNSRGSSVVETFSPVLGAGEVVTKKQELNQIDAVSVIESPECPVENLVLQDKRSTTFDTYFCIAWRVPYMTSTFLFRPTLGIDTTSTLGFLAALENIFWFGLFLAIIVLAIRRRAFSFLAPIIPTLIFFSVYVLGASAYQGNMGTGFRHKSLILWAVLLLILALAWRKPEEISGKPRNNSQESAV
jgi:hypothetical protein